MGRGKTGPLTAVILNCLNTIQNFSCSVWCTCGERVCLGLLYLLPSLEVLAIFQVYLLHNE